MTHRIEIAFDNPAADEFIEWLNAQGHTASVGRSTGNYVNGAWTSADENAREIMNSLWNEFCNS